MYGKVDIYTRLAGYINNLIDKEVAYSATPITNKINSLLKGKWYSDTNLKEHVAPPMYFDASSVNESFFKRCIVAHCQHIISMQMKTLANVFSLYCAQCRHARMLGIFFFWQSEYFQNGRRTSGLPSQYRAKRNWCQICPHCICFPSSFYPCLPLKYLELELQVLFLSRRYFCQICPACVRSILLSNVLLRSSDNTKCYSSFL